MEDLTAEIEEAIVAQWSFLGRWPGGRLHEEPGLVWFETPIRHLPYNGVIRTRLGASEADAAIARITDYFRGHELPFMWFVHPSATPTDLGGRLAKRGLRQVEEGTCMLLELADWEPPALPEGVVFERVRDSHSLQDYSHLNADYWEIPEDEREAVVEFQRHLGPGRVPGHRYLARVDGEPVGKAYLSLAGPPGLASIYGMSVRPELRGRGIAGGLTTTLIQRARHEGRTRVALMSSEMAIGVYRRAGFRERFSLPVFATAALWTSAD